jgi:hypothetical protein
MQESQNELHELFCSHYAPLDEEEIIEINKNMNSGDLNNVIVGLEQHFYCTGLIDDTDKIEYQLYFVRGGNKLEGDVLRLTVDNPKRDDLVFYFSNFLSHNYPEIDLIDTFNTFQKQTRGMLENIGYLTIASTELDRYDDPNPVIMAKGVKGIIPIRFFRKIEFYKEFFGNKKLEEINLGEHHIYLMLNKRNNYIKIGKSKKPNFREKTLQAQEPEIEMITFWQAPANIETQLKKQFSEKKQRGEWFKLSFKELNEIKKQMSIYK